MRNKLPDVTELTQRIVVADAVISQGTTETQPPVTEIEPVNVESFQLITTRASTSLRRTAPETQEGPEGYTPRRSTRQNNPPFVTLFFEKNRNKCLGCNSWINKKDFPHPETYCLH